MQYGYERKNIYKQADEKQLTEIYAFAEEYKKFLAVSKTERGATATAKKLCEEHGFKPFTFGDKIKAGDKQR